MLRWSTLSVGVAVATVLFGFDGISAGTTAIGCIALVAAIAIGVLVAARAIAARLELGRG
jgi:hypothetical protein